MTVTVASDADHDDLVAAVTRLAEEVEQLREENEQLRDDLEETRDELESLRDRAGRDRAELSGRVTELETIVDDVDHADDGDTAVEGDPSDEPAVPDAETALEETLQLPDGVAEDSLSANQARARSVARDIGDYAEYNHEFGNYSLTAKRLRIVLKAQSEENTAHHETVKRVREFLDQLGESEVSITEDRGGTKRLVFAESLVDRIEAHQAHGGVRGETVGTGVGT